MNYRVVVTNAAIKTIREQARYLALDCDVPDTAERWLRSVLDSAGTLCAMPRRCARAPEADYRPYDIRWLGVGNYMLLFTIDDDSKTVFVISARHGRQLPRLDDLPLAVSPEKS